MFVGCPSNINSSLFVLADFSTLTDMSLKNKLIQCLQELKNVDYTDASRARASNGKAENALNLIYQAGKKQTIFTDQEKKTLGSLLANAIKPIQINVESTASVYRTRLDNSVLMKRSAIQFLIDNFAHFPVGNSFLATKLTEADIKESVEILDNIIVTWCDASDSEEGSSDREEAGSKEVPSSHTWWSE